MLRESKQKDYSVAILSYDEKPGIQAIENTAPDLPPVPGEKPYIARDHEYVRHGTVSLMAGIDFLNGHIHGIVVDRRRSREFVQFQLHNPIDMLFRNHYTRMYHFGSFNSIHFTF